jgi:hypothetical protein
MPAAVQLGTVAAVPTTAPSSVVVLLFVAFGSHWSFGFMAI